MSKIIRLTESDLTRIVKRVLKEEQQQEKVNMAKQQFKSQTSSCWNKFRYPLLNAIIDGTASTPFCAAAATYALMTQPLTLANLAINGEEPGKYTNSEGRSTLWAIADMPSLLATGFCGMAMEKVQDAIENGITKNGKLKKEVQSYYKCLTS
jgi:hypothetical protein